MEWKDGNLMKSEISPSVPLGCMVVFALVRVCL